jgi:hypothetical protein
MCLLHREVGHGANFGVLDNLGPVYNRGKYRREGLLGHFMFGATKAVHEHFLSEKYTLYKMLLMYCRFELYFT